MSVFLLSVKGQIERVTMPDYPELFIKFQFVYGQDWIVTTGIEEGITQICKRYDAGQDFAFNYPLDVTLKSTSPHGWPQIVLCIYGKDTWGQEVIRGYGSTFVPISLGSNLRKTIGLFVPEASNMVSKLSSLLSGRSPELYDPRILTRNRGRELLRTTSKGCVHVMFNIISKDCHRLAYSLPTASPNHPVIQLPTVPTKTDHNNQASLRQSRPSTQDERRSSRAVAADRGDDGSHSPHAGDSRDLEDRTQSSHVHPSLSVPHAADLERRPFSSSSQPALSPRITVVRR